MKYKYDNGVEVIAKFWKDMMIEERQNASPRCWADEYFWDDTDLFVMRNPDVDGCLWSYMSNPKKESIIDGGN